jgi:hypothetical protein
MHRTLSAAIAAIACLVALAPPAEAASISRETLTRRLLDTCIYRQFQMKDIERSRMVERCHCASDTAMKTIEGTEFEMPRSGGLTGPQDAAIRTAIAACFPQMEAAKP